MKHLIRRGLGVALAVVMATGLLSSCGSDYDPVQDIMGYKGSTVLFTVNGQDVTAEQYLFWLAQQADTTYSCASMMQSDDSETSFWDTKVDENSDKTIADQVKAAAQNYAAMYSVVEAKGKEEGYSYTSEDKASYQEDLATAKEQLGGEDAYAKYLKSMCISNKGFEHLSSVSFIHSHMVDGMFQDGKENAPTAEDLTQYAEDNDLLVAKHILLLTKDMTTGEDLSDTEKAEKKAKADDLLKQLQAITDPTELESKFDELMKANSEDTGLESSPDGYVFSAGDMVEAFESATRSLEPGQLSGIVESDYGYHIILRLDPATSKAFRENYSSEKLREMEKQWVDEADIKTTETYDNLSVADFYDKLTAYRDSLNTDADQAEEENQQVEQDTGDENAALPTMASMESGETSLRAPSSSDFKFLEMCSNATADLVCFFAAEAQKTLAHKKPLGLFYGYTDMDNQIYWNTNAYEKAWRSPDIDMLYSPAAYRDNRFFTGVSSYQYTVDSIALHNKLYVHENDHRTDLARFPLESGVILQDCYASFEEWREVFRRELCNVMQKRAGFWWFDFFGGYYNAPEYEQELAFQKKIYDQLAEGERHSNSEIAVFIDPMSFNCTKELSRLCSDLGRVSVNALLRCGAPFDLYNLSDITLIDKSQYKMYVFLNAFIMPEDIRAYIHNELSDRLTVFLYGSGMARGDSFDIANTAELCGMTIEEIDSSKPLKADYLGETFGFTKHIRPLFAVKGAAAEPLARYENGEICAAIKGHAAYCAMAPVPWTLWRDLARRAGVHIYSEQGSGTAISSQFVSAYTTLTEDCALHMKEDGVYRDVFSGETYETENGMLRYHAKKGRVMLFVREEK